MVQSAFGTSPVRRPTSFSFSAGTVMTVAGPALADGAALGDADALGRGVTIEVTLAEGAGSSTTGSVADALTEALADGALAVTVGAR